MNGNEPYRASATNSVAYYLGVITRRKPGLGSPSELAHAKGFLMVIIPQDGGTNECGSTPKMLGILLLFQ